MIHKYQHYDLLGKMIFERVIFTPPLRLNETMDSEACLLYSVSGKSTLYLSDDKYDLDSGKGIFMKCGNYFNHWHKNKDDSKNEAVAIHLYPEIISHVYKNKVPDFLVSKRSYKSTELSILEKEAFLRPFIESILLYFDNPSLVDDEVIVLKIRELINVLYKTNSNNIRILLHDMFTPTQLNFKDIVEKNIYQDLSMEELAHLCNMSLSSFKRKFKELFDEPPASYIRNKRLEKAAELLRVSENRIIEIAFDCGFSNTDMFSKSFKSKFGKSPSAYRKSFEPN